MVANFLSTDLRKREILAKARSGVLLMIWLMIFAYSSPPPSARKD
jgi:hypothetical protein